MGKNSIYTLHEMINRVGFEFDENDAKKVINLSTKAAELAANNMSEKLSEVAQEIGKLLKQILKLIMKT